MALPSRSRTPRFRDRAGYVQDIRKVSKCACVFGPRSFVFDCFSSLVVHRRLCVVGLSEPRPVIIISPLSTITLTQHCPTLRVSLVGLGQSQTGWCWCYANHFSAAALRSKLNQHHFRIAPPDSEGPTVFEDQTAWRQSGIFSRRPHAPSRFCRLNLTLHPMSTRWKQRQTSPRRK